MPFTRPSSRTLPIERPPCPRCGTRKEVNARDTAKGIWVCLKCHGKRFRAEPPPRLTDEEYEAYVKMHQRRSRVRPTHRICPGCHSIFKVGPMGPIPRWCSDECRRDHHRQHRSGELRTCAAKRCNVEFYSYNATQIFCSPGCQKRPDAVWRNVCPSCATALTDEDDGSGRFCKVCGWATYWEPEDYRSCRYCNLPFIPKSKKNVYCSSECCDRERK